MSEHTKNQYRTNKQSCFDLKYLEKKKDEILKYYQDSNNPLPFVFHRTELIQTLYKKVEEYGLIFIESPMLKGKTTLLKSFEEYINESKKDFFLFDIIERNNYVGNPKVNDVVELYTKWTHTILSEIHLKYKLENKQIKNRLYRLITNPSKIKEKLRNRVNEEEINYFESFLEIIQYYIERLEKKIVNKFSFYLIIRLDDFNTYINRSTYKKFEDDIRKLTDDGETHINSDKIKLIISTRMFPSARPNRIFFYINNFSEFETKIFIKESLKIKDGCEYNLYELIYKKTNGHPWFVNRFIEIFIMLYLDNKKIQKLYNETKLDNTKLKEENTFINTISNNEDLWKKNNIFKNNNKKSLFLRKVQEKVQDCLNDTPLKEFINTQVDNKDIIFLRKYSNNLLINELGLINFIYDDTVEDVTIKGNCNIIIENIFINELKDLISEYE